MHGSQNTALPMPVHYRKEAGDMLVFMAGYSPIYGRQALYFQDEILSARSEVQPPELTDRTRTPEAPAEDHMGQSREQLARQGACEAVSRESAK